MKKIIILGLGVAAFFMQGCDFLDRTPEDIIETGKFFESANANALEQYCNDFYPKLINGHGAPKGYNSMLEDDWNSDNILPWEKNDVSFGHQIAVKNASDEGSDWKWENIRACNEFLMNYEKSPETEIVKQQYAGEILFFKCMDYFNKVRKYGDLPWYDTALTPSDTEELYKGRDSRILVMDNVLRDINQAIAWLPKKTKVYRVSKDAALALKARICLFEGTYRRYHNIENDTKFLQAAYDAAVEKEKASVLEKTYRDNMITALSPTSKAAWEALTPAEQTTSKLEAILDDTVKQAKAKADANATLAEWLKLDQTVADLAAKGEAAGNQALADDKDKKVEKAKAALVEAAGKAATAVAKVAPAISTYSALAANPYGQILANTVSVEDMTGKDAFYKEEEKDGKKTGHMQALRSDISADEFTKLSATKLDRNTAEDALEYTSDATFGTVIPGEDRLVEVTEAMVRAYIKQNNSAVLTDFGTLGAMMAANDDVQTCKDMIAAADLIKPLKAQMEGVLADLNAEINTNTALMDPFIAKADETRIALKTAKEEVKKAQEEQDALTAEAEANSKKFAELIQDYDGLISVVQDQIDGINGGVVTGTVVTVESVLNYWKNEVATQEKSVEEAKQKVTAAEKSIELFNKGEYKEAYVIEQKKLALETAQEAYDVAKAIYDTALAQVKAVLETLSK